MNKKELPLQSFNFCDTLFHKVDGMTIEAKQRKETASEYALRVLKQNIVSLDLAPGSMVSENEMAARLGISRTPVREALIELSRVGIVEILPQKGSRINLIDYDMVEQSRFLRLVLEREVVKLVCTSEASVDLSSLEENLRLQSFYIEHPNREKLLELDNQFHALLFTAVLSLDDGRLDNPFRPGSLHEPERGEGHQDRKRPPGHLSSLGRQGFASGTAVDGETPLAIQD